MNKKTLIPIIIMAVALLVSCDKLGISYKDDAKKTAPKQPEIVTLKQNDVPKNDAEINSLYDQVAKLQGDINAHLDTINTQKNEIEQLNNSIAQLNSEINNKTEIINNFSTEKTKSTNVIRILAILFAVSIIINLILIKIKFFNKSKKNLLALPEAKKSESNNDKQKSAETKTEPLVTPKKDEVTSSAPKKRGRPKSTTTTKSKPATDTKVAKKRGRPKAVKPDTNKE